MSDSPPRPIGLRAAEHRRRTPMWLAAVLATSVAWPAAARCVDESAFDPAAGLEPNLPPMAEPRVQLQSMVRDALERSNAVGAAKLMAEAAIQDIAEARAAKGVQAGLTAGVGPAMSNATGVPTETTALQARAGLNISQLLFDGGRVDRMTDWRSHLAESARFGHLTQQEQLATTTVALALERSRFRQHVLVYGQYVRKMSCLVEALGTIVAADRGRASELVQAKKSLQQAELSQSQAQSQVRQIEVRLRRLVGDGLPGIEGLSTVLLQVPDLPDLVADVERSTEIAQLGAQAAAAAKYADVVAAGDKPQLSWSFAGSQSAGLGGSNGNTRNGTFSVGIQVNVPLINPGNAPASDAARKRAAAAAMQRAEALDARRYRVTEVYEQTQSSFDRARRVGAVLRDSEQVRNFTLQQWQQLGRRSLFDVMGAEAEHYNLRVSYVNALHDGQQMNAVLLSLGRGVNEWLR